MLRLIKSNEAILALSIGLAIVVTFLNTLPGLF